MLINIKNLKKYYGDRLVLDIKDFNLYDGDRVGLVGLNGSGKTTLLNILVGEEEFDGGTVNISKSYFYIKQLEDLSENPVDKQYLNKFKIKNTDKKTMSGGELTKLKISGFFNKNTELLLADEPTSNLDLKGKEILMDRLLKHQGGIFLVSHDRDFLDNICNKIAELEDGHIKIYEGDYRAYKEQKEVELKTKALEYEKYISEKNRLENVMLSLKTKSSKIKSPPKRMGNSEARLHKMGGQKGKKTLDNSVKAVQTRIEKLEVKEKIKDRDYISLDINGDEIYSKIVIEGENINKSFGSRKLLENANFQIYNKSKIAIIGDNGVGKTTLLKMILNKEENIRISQRAKIGYFSQNFSILDEEKNMLDNLLDTGANQQEVRDILGRFLFKKDDVYKKVKVISGGEKVKLSLAKILISDFNILILDEPTNYLDIHSIEIIEEALINYTGTIIFVSHDIRLIDKLADGLIIIENKKLKTFNGSYEEYKNKPREKSDKKHLIDEKAILENKLSEIIGKISIAIKEEEKQVLDIEYFKILNEIKNIKELLK